MIIIYYSGLQEIHICWPVNQETEAKKQAKVQAFYVWQDDWYIGDSIFIPLHSKL